MPQSKSSAVVTGGASGLGRAVVEMLRSRDVGVVIADRNIETGKQTASDLDAVFVETDVSSEESAGRAVEAAVELGPLRLVVNCAGVAPSQRLIDRHGNLLPVKRFEIIVRVNLIGTFNMMRHAAAAMSANTPNADGERGVIVNTASVAAFDGQAGQIAYAAAKAGVVGMTLPATRDLSPAGIRVCAIAPGVIDTPLAAQMDEKNRAALEQIIQQPKRPGKPSEFAALVAHIVDNPYLNGEVIRLDGGLRMPPK